MDEYDDQEVRDWFTPSDAYHGDNAPRGHYDTGE